MSLDDAYRHCTRVTRAAAKNFYYGIRLLPERKRRALSAVYAFSRLADDAVDDHLGAKARYHLDRVRKLLDRALAGVAADDPDPVAAALADAIRTFCIPVEPFFELIAGMEMDLAHTSYETFEELAVYCRRVAGSVGRLCLAIFGYADPQAVELADEMGIALQLTNILRDVKEDLERGRVYLPAAELRRHGVRLEELQRGEVSQGLIRVLADLALRAKGYYRRAEALFGLVAPDARLCLMALHTIYRELLLQIEAGGYDVFGPRVRLSTTRKLQLVGQLFWRTWRDEAGRA
jgi:phytoene synthase